jgi:5-methylcytosine-specific restriction endonuclease McrA
VSKCGGRIEFDANQLIPVSKGGSNSARNIELLCEVCNRSKSDLIQ